MHNILNRFGMYTEWQHRLTVVAGTFVGLIVMALGIAIIVAWLGMYLKYMFPV